MLNKTLQKFLATNKAKYEIIEHKTVYTAFDKAATLRAKPQEVGKSVVVCFDKKHYMLGLIPANKNLDKKKLLKTIPYLKITSYKDSIKDFYLYFKKNIETLDKDAIIRDDYFTKSKVKR